MNTILKVLLPMNNGNKILALLIALLLSIDLMLYFMGDVI